MKGNKRGREKKGGNNRERRTQRGKMEERKM